MINQSVSINKSHYHPYVFNTIYFETVADVAVVNAGMDIE